MIETHRLTKRYGERVGVEDVTLSVRGGEVFGLLGPNGAGKTTTLRMLATLLTPTAGTATVGGIKLGDDDEGVRAQLGYLPENPGLYERLTAEENLIYFARLYGIDAATAKQRAGRTLAEFDLSARARDRVSDFSKGMRQKLALGRALLHEPKILLLDEPTSGLDPEASAELRERIRGLRDKGRAVVLCTHRLEEAEAICDSVGVVKTKLLAQTSVTDATSGSTAVAVRVTFRGELPEDSLVRARAADGVRSVALDGSRLVAELDSPDAAPALVRALVEAGASVAFVEPSRRKLEDFYLSLVGKTSAADVPKAEARA